MQWTDKGIVLSVRKLGEHSGLVHLLTPSQGLHAGVDRGAFSKARRGLYQAGNVVAVQWKARLAEQVGMFACELLEANAARLLDNRVKLAALSSAALLVERMLAEREAQPDVYDGMEMLLHALCDDGPWQAAYVRLELTLLACSGFGLDLESCAATGQAHDLRYVSPRSGRAVSGEAGQIYRDRLFSLPAFLLPNTDGNAVNAAQILDGLRLCGYFLEARVFAPRGARLPEARAQFIHALSL